MHGRVKVRSTEEQQELKRIEKEKKLKLFRAAIDKTFEKRKNGEFDEDALEVAGQPLSANPDIYTLWNFRREILLDLKEKRSEDDYRTFMEGELKLTLQCLRANPKSYGGWHHRVWVLDNMQKPNWPQELALCNKYLEMDERNFHVWDHRRFVVNRAKVPSKDELAYSTTKITTNFSNYSSWHYRSGLLPKIYPDPQGKRPIREEEHKEELDLVQNACFTDPNDQSAWFYQRWLLGRSEQPLGLGLVLVSPDCVCIALTRATLLNDEDVALTINGAAVEGAWASSSGETSHVWVFYPSTELDTETYYVVVTVLRDGIEVDSMTVEVIDGEGLGHRKAQFGAGFTKGLTSVLEEQLDSCLQLFEMEPDSKWTLLTSVLLMQAIDRHKYKDETMQKLDQLLQLDPLRTGYYRDLRSRFVMEYAINTMDEMLTKSDLHRDIDLSNQNLTAFYHGHHLSLLLKVDLANNKLHRSLSQFHTLQSCTWLCLDNNSIENLRDFPMLPALHTLLIRGNKIKTLEDLNSIEKCASIGVLDVTGNPVQYNFLLPDRLKELLPGLKILNEKAL